MVSGLTGIPNGFKKNLNPGVQRVLISLKNKISIKIAFTEQLYVFDYLCGYNWNYSQNREKK